MCSHIYDVLMCLLNVITRAHSPHPQICLPLHSHFFFFMFSPFFSGQSLVLIPNSDSHGLLWDAQVAKWLVQSSQAIRGLLKSRHSPQTPRRALSNLSFYSCLFDHWFPQLTWTFQGHSFCLFLSASAGAGWFEAKELFTNDLAACSSGRSLKHGLNTDKWKRMSGSYKGDLLRK